MTAPDTGSTRSGMVVASSSKTSSSLLGAQQVLVGRHLRPLAGGLFLARLDRRRATRRRPWPPRTARARRGPAARRRPATSARRRPARSGRRPGRRAPAGPGPGVAVPVAASPTHTPMPSLSSTVKTNRRPSGAQDGTLTEARSGSASCCSAPSGSAITDRPVSRRVRWRLPVTGSIRYPASDRCGRASVGHRRIGLVAHQGQELAAGRQHGQRGGRGIDDRDDVAVGGLVGHAGSLSAVGARPGRVTAPTARRRWPGPIQAGAPGQRTRKSGHRHNGLRSHRNPAGRQ